jgi:hypothetical protein
MELPQVGRNGTEQTKRKKISNMLYNTHCKKSCVVIRSVLRHRCPHGNIGILQYMYIQYIAKKKRTVKQSTRRGNSRFTKK